MVVLDKNNQKNVRKHFEENLLFSKLFWMNKSNLSLHMGFWTKGTKNLDEALVNENKYVAKCLDIKNADTVLDVGCGVGGTAIWIAENYGVKVTGIDLVPENIKLAKKYAKERDVDHLVTFRLQDSAELNPISDKYNKIYAIEAFCYIADKLGFVHQISNNLRDGGKLVIADYFKGQNIAKPDAALLSKWCKEWAIPNLLDFDSMKSELGMNGFKEIDFEDKTTLMLNSSRKLRRKTLALYPAMLLFRAARLISDYPDKEIIIKEPRMFEGGVIKYASFQALK